MGSGGSKHILSYEDANARFTPDELETLRTRFNAIAHDAGIDRGSFEHYFMRGVPLSLVDAVYEAFKSGAKTLALRDLVCGLAVFLRGTVPERTALVFRVYDVAGQGVLSAATMRPLIESGDPVSVLQSLFGTQTTGVTFEQFDRWVRQNPDATGLVRWIFLPPPPPVAAVVAAHQGYHQALAALSPHLTQAEVQAVERRFYDLRSRAWATGHGGHSAAGLSAAALQSALCPPLPPALVPRLVAALALLTDSAAGTVHVSDAAATAAAADVGLKALVCGVSLLLRGTDAARLAWCVALFDGDGDGYLDQEDVVGLLGTLEALNATALSTSTDGAVGKAAAARSQTYGAGGGARGNDDNDNDNDDDDDDDVGDRPLKSASSPAAAGKGTPRFSRNSTVIGSAAAESAASASAAAITPWPPLPPPKDRAAADTRAAELLRTLADKPATSKGASQQTKATITSVAAWAEESGALAPLLAALVHVCHATFGVRPADAAGEGQVIHQRRVHDQLAGLLSQPGAPAFLVPLDWWLRWQRFTSQPPAVGAPVVVTPAGCGPASGSQAAATAAAVGSAGVPGPGPIPTQQLCASATAARLGGGIGNGHWSPRLRTGLALNRDFVAVAPPTWALLQQWYGLAGPPLERPVLHAGAAGESAAATATAAAALVLELYPLGLRLHQQPGPAASSAAGNSSAGSSSATAATSAGANNSKSDPTAEPMYVATLEVSRTATVREMLRLAIAEQRHLARGHRNITAAGARLWHYFPKTAQPPRLLDSAATVAAAGLEAGAAILLEVRNDDLSWPSELLWFTRRGKKEAKSGNAASTPTPDANPAAADLGAGSTPGATVSSGATTSGGGLLAMLSGRPAVPREPGATGLSNLGNTCFLNSALQCLSHVHVLTAYFLRGCHRGEINRDNPLGTKGLLARRYAALVSDLWSGRGCAAPAALRRAVGTVAEQFADGQQHDAQELLALLIDSLHEDLNRITRKPYVERKDSNGRPDAIVAAEGWAGHVLRNQSVVVDLLHGLLRSRVSCHDCGFASVAFDPFTFLTLPLPSEALSVVDIKLQRLDGTVPVLYALEIGTDATFGSLRVALAELCGVPADTLVFADVPYHTVTAIHRDHQRVRAGTGAAALVAFEVDLAAAAPAPPTPPPEPATEFAADAEAYAVESSTTSSQALRAALLDKFVSRHSIVGHLMAVHRRFEVDPHHTLVAPLYSVVFGSPLLVPYTVGKSTNAELYAAVWQQLARFVRPAARAKVTGPGSYPFALSVVNTGGGVCGLCPWYRFCLGCPRPCDDTVVTLDPSHVLAVDWPDAAYHLDFDHTEERRILEDASVAAMQAKNDQPITLDACLEAFTREEDMGPDNLWFCPACKTHRRASKKLDIWTLPPVLMIHLKRFHMVNGRWIKSQRHVKFPTSGFDPYAFSVAAPAPPPAAEETTGDETMVSQEPATTTTAAPSPAPVGTAATPIEDATTRTVLEAPWLSADTIATDARRVPGLDSLDPHAGFFRNPAGPRVYHLTAVSVHHGVLGGGHYVAYARGPSGQWHFYNDSAVKPVSEERVSKDDGYILVYTAAGLDGHKFLARPTAAASPVPSSGEDGEEDASDEHTISDEKGSSCVVC